MWPRLGALVLASVAACGRHAPARVTTAPVTAVPVTAAAQAELVAEAGPAAWPATGRPATGRDAGPPEASADTLRPSIPLWSDPPIVPLDVPGFPQAVISVPLGAMGPKPLVVATHGLWDPPEGLCDDWRWIVHDRAWVLCPRGESMPDKTFRYRSGPALAREIDAAIQALSERFPGYVDPGPILYTGFSLGAILGVWLITHDPKRYPRAVLTEGGEDRFTADPAARYARGGGQRVLFACGLRFRVPAAEKAAAILSRAGVPSRVVLGKLPETGQFIHWYNGPVASETQQQLGWLLEGDPRW